MTASRPDDRKTAAAVVAGISAGSRTALARGLTWLERDDPRAAELRRAFPPGPRPRHVVGVTGAPGAGKSTLIGALSSSPAYRDRPVAALLLDPVSPLFGGALLADRVRFGGTLREALFVRSIPVAHSDSASLVDRVLVPALALLAAQDFDVVIVETVGAGQEASPVVGLVDTLVLLVTPDAGDTTQFRKRGVLELVDVVVLNRADAPRAASMRRELATSLPSLAGRPVVETVATAGAGVADLARLLVELELRPDAAALEYRRRRARLLDCALINTAQAEFGAVAKAVLAELRAGSDAAQVTPTMLLRAVAARVAADSARAEGVNECKMTPSTTR